MSNAGELRNQGGKKVLLCTLPHTAEFLDVVTRYTAMRKLALYDHVFRVGFREVFGITEEELAECEVIPPPSALAAPHKNDLRQLTNLICGEPEDG